jgi:hypothetical protein
MKTYKFPIDTECSKHELDAYYRTYLNFKSQWFFSKQNTQEKFPLHKYTCKFQILLIHGSKWKGWVYKVSEVVIYGWNAFATSILRRVIFHFIFKIALKCLADCTKSLNVQLAVYYFQSLGNLGIV